MKPLRLGGAYKTGLFSSRWIKLLCVLGVAGSCSFGSRAQNSSADELEIRAAMVFNLTKFIDWPTWKVDQTHPDFVVCLLGSDPLAVNLEGVLKNKQINNKPVVLRRINFVDAASSCHILYLGISQHQSLTKAASVLEKNAVLVMSDKPNANDPVQIVGLPTMEEHVRIEVNLSAAKRSGLTLSSKLLRLATVTN